MRVVHESAQIVRRSVEAAGRKEIDAVITPAEFARKIRDRHHLDHGDSNSGQLRQFLRRRPPGAFARERADMHLVNDLARHFDALPVLIAPVEPRGIHDTRRPVDSLRLETRRGIRMECFRLVDPKAVERAGVRRDGRRKNIRRLPPRADGKFAPPHFPGCFPGRRPGVLPSAPRPENASGLRRSAPAPIG